MVEKTYLTDEHRREALLARMEQQIYDLRELQRMSEHLQAGGSWDEPWIQEILKRPDEDEVDLNADEPER